MLNEYSTRQAILVCMFLWYASRNAQVLILVKPQDMEIAATLCQFAEECLNSVYSMQ